MCNENKGTIKELLVLDLHKKRSKNKELLELSLELGSLFKKSLYDHKGRKNSLKTL